MSRQRYLILGAFAISACSSDRNGSEAGDDANAEPAAEPAKAVALPPLTPLGKPAAELEAERWTAAEIPPELAARLRDSTAVNPWFSSPAIQRELRALAQPENTPSFDGGFADTVRLIEGALIRMATERNIEREAEIVDSLKRAMEPRDPDLDAVSAVPKLLQPALQGHPNGAMPVHLTSSREELPSWGTVLSPTGPVQQSKSRTIQIAPGVNGTENTSSDGSSTTTEVGFKKGGSESVTKSTTTSPQEYLKNGEIGVKHEISSTKRAKAEGAANEEIERAAWEERLGYCPDAGGIVRGRYARTKQSSQVTTVGDVTINRSIDLHGEFTLTVSVDDNARAQEAMVEGTSVLKIAVGARGGGNARPTLKELRADGRWQHSVHDPQTYKDAKATLQGGLHYRLSSADEADRRFDQVLIENLGHAMGAATSLAKQAEQRWRNGACVQVITNPMSKALRYGGKTTFRAEVRHKRDSGGAFSYPVRVLGEKKQWVDAKGEHSGARVFGSFAPQGAVTAPATFSYTAPGKGSESGKLWRGSSPPRDEMFPCRSRAGESA